MIQAEAFSLFYFIHQAKMPGNDIANLFARIPSVIRTHNGEKAAVCVFVIMLLAIDACKTLAIILHHSYRIVTTVNDI